MIIEELKKFKPLEITRVYLENRDSFNLYERTILRRELRRLLNRC